MQSVSTKEDNSSVIPTCELYLETPPKVPYGSVEKRTSAPWLVPLFLLRGVSVQSSGGGAEGRGDPAGDVRPPGDVTVASVRRSVRRRHTLY